MVSRPLRAVFFDAGNTLIRMNYPVIAAELAAHGVTATAGDLESAEWRARVRLDDALGRAGRVSTETPATADRYLGLILDELGVREASVAAALGAWRARYNPPVGLWNVAAPGAEAALRRVREAGLGAAVISNSNGSVRAILESLGLAGYLDFILDSSEVGVEKPDPRIFRLALERAGLGAPEAVYVGDLYSVDVLGARGVGLEAILLDPGGHWGVRDCPTARDVVGAVGLALGDEPRLRVRSDGRFG
jgi:HAD superfamily hydrolase (TIGR01509 family)